MEEVDEGDPCLSLIPKRKYLMENGDWTFVSQPKRRKVKFSGIRDFPEGCGPYPKTSDFGNSNDKKLLMQELEDKEFKSDGSKFSSSSYVSTAGSKPSFAYRRIDQSVRNYPLLSGPYAYYTHECTLQLPAIENSNSTDDGDEKEVGNNVQDGSICPNQKVSDECSSS